MYYGFSMFQESNFQKFESINKILYITYQTNLEIFKLPS